jgi:hypothetical protein
MKINKNDIIEIRENVDFSVYWTFKIEFNKIVGIKSYLLLVDTFPFYPTRTFALSLIKENIYEY